MNPITKFFHELFNPHCLHCATERQLKADQDAILAEESKHCNTCEVLQMELARLHEMNKTLLNKLSPDEVPAPVNTGNLKPINTSRFIPWHVKQQQLELASRMKAAELRKAEDAKQNAAAPDVPVSVDTNVTDQLELELGISDATKQSA